MNFKSSAFCSLIQLLPFLNKCQSAYTIENMKIKNTIKIVSIAALISLTAACKSAPKIPEDATYTQLIQMGQDAMGSGNYSASEAYFNTVIKRFGMDTNIYIEAKYELGHMYLKQKQYDEAYACFNEIKGIYEAAEFGQLQTSYKKLCDICIQQIPEKHRK